MRSFIFITAEGYTYQPNSQAIEPDAENCQVIGFASGTCENTAFENLRENSPWLLKSKFNELISYELLSDKKPTGYFYLKQ